MTSQFYSRYIPPLSNATAPEAASRPSKKRKLSKSITTFVPSQEKGPVTKRIAQDAVAPDQEALLSTKQDYVADGQAFPLRSPHQAVLSKYEEAKRQSAEKLRKSSAIEENSIDVQYDHMDTEPHGLESLPQPVETHELPKISMVSALPEWLRSATHVSSASTVPFNSLSINEKTATSLQEAGYEIAFAIQAAILPMLLPGPEHYHGDICISAATGSGKTLAYALPIVESLRDKPVTKLRGLIVVPTRELISQVKETFDLCNGGSGLKIGTAVGSKTLRDEQAMLVEEGQRYDPEAYRAEKKKEIDEDEELMDWDFEKRFGPKDEIELLYNHVVEYTSKVDILICTPGKLVEHVEYTTGFTLEHVQWLVIDEADRLLDESFQQWIDVLLPGLEYLPPLDPIQQRIADAFHTLRRREVQKIILSATMTRDISKLTALKLRRPKLVVLEGMSQHKPKDGNELPWAESTERVELPTTLEEFGVKVSKSNEKPLYLIQLLESQQGSVSDKANVKPIKAQESSDGKDTSSDESASQQANSGGAGTVPDSIALSTTHRTLIFTKTNEHATRLARLISPSSVQPGPQR
ncbi:hypothetical protein N7G274_010833 [Stereocaulon virgatum]|uniref:ATP-dependent RNA helicase n=1 Tax=Stereocaulon virgatum TaxID=373712 RepID=A0ABR3ZUV7_9LECA